MKNFHRRHFDAATVVACIFIGISFGNVAVVPGISSFVAVAAAAEKVPLIFDMDANYDDTLALMYLVSNPLFDIKAVTVAGAGFATHHGYVFTVYGLRFTFPNDIVEPIFSLLGLHFPFSRFYQSRLLYCSLTSYQTTVCSGPINQQQVLQLFGVGEIPVSYGPPMSLSPITTFPMQWRIEIDEFFQSENLDDSETPLSVFPSDILIANILRDATTAVTVAETGPATNLALALQREPELASRIGGLFLMGSNYGGGPNNVYDWQMTFNGVRYVSLFCVTLFLLTYSSTLDIYPI